MPAIEAIPVEPHLKIDADKARAMKAAATVEELVAIQCGSAACCLSATCEFIAGRKPFQYDPGSCEDIILPEQEVLAVTFTGGGIDCSNPVHVINTVEAVRSALNAAAVA